MSGDVGVEGGIDRNGCRRVREASAQQSGIEQVGAGKVELRDKSGGIAGRLLGGEGLEGARSRGKGGNGTTERAGVDGGGAGGERGARNVKIEFAVERDRPGAVVAGSAEVG